MIMIMMMMMMMMMINYDDATNDDADGDSDRLGICRNSRLRNLWAVEWPMGEHHIISVLLRVCQEKLMHGH